MGDGDTDHYCWQRPEDMSTSRQAYKIDEKNPGSDLAGETAAAMAAASIVFKKTNPHYSHLLLHHAQEVILKMTHTIYICLHDCDFEFWVWWCCSCLSLGISIEGNMMEA